MSCTTVIEQHTNSASTRKQNTHMHTHAETEDSTKGIRLGIITEKIKGVPKGTMCLWCMGQLIMVVECHTPLPRGENVHRPPDPQPHSLMRIVHTPLASRDAWTSRQRTAACWNSLHEKTPLRRGNWHTHIPTNSPQPHKQFTHTQTRHPHAHPHRQRAPTQAVH